MAELGAVIAGGDRPASQVRSGREYYTAISLVILAIVVGGFVRSFFLRPFFSTHHALDLSGSSGMPALVIAHGAVLTAWFLLFVAQVRLVATNRTYLHRRLGVATVVVAALLIAVTLPTIILSMARFDHAGIPRMVSTNVAINDFLSLAWFALLIGIAVYMRRRPETHKRLMVLASIAILAPATARIGDMFGNAVVVIVGGQIALWLSLAIHDFATRKRLHSATIWGGLLIVIVSPLLAALLNALYTGSRGR